MRMSEECEGCPCGDCRVTARNDDELICPLCELYEYNHWKLRVTLGSPNVIPYKAIT